MAASYDIAIVGAGIVGAACAWECAQAGLRVAVIEAAIPGGGATAAGMGHIVVMDDSPAQLALTLYSRKLWQQLAPDLPASAEYEQCGTIWAAADEEEMREVERKNELYASVGIRSEILDSKSLAAAEPQLRPGLAGGLLVPDDAVSYPPCATRYLLDRACDRGSDLFIGLPATSLESDGVKQEDGTLVHAGLILNATGAWAPMLTPGLDIRKRKGHLIITERYPGLVRHPLVELGYLKSAHSETEDSVAFNVQPRYTGQLLIGSSRQYGVEESSIDMPILTRMLARAREYMPGLASLAAIRSWTGFRAATPDRLPLIGPHGSQRNLLLATGHEGLGITTSLGTAKLIVDHLLGRTPEIPAEPYLASRVSGENRV